MLRLILGGAALQRCDDRSVFNSGFSAEVALQVGKEFFSDLLEP